MIRSCIVGCGAISAVHAAALKAMPDVTVVGCADCLPERAETRAAELGCKAYTDLDTMLDEQKPDVLHICTPHYLHVPMALNAAKRGIAVLTEKPAGISLEQLDQLTAAEENGAIIGVCFQNRYNSAVVKARKLLNSGETGRIIGVRAFVTWHREAPYYTESGWRGSMETEGGGVMINQAIHTLDLIQYLAGYPRFMEGHVDNYHLKDVISVEDTATAYMKLPGDVPAILLATTAYAADSPVILEILCENRRLLLTGNNLQVFDPSGWELISQVPEKAAQPSVGKCYWGDGHPGLFRDFYDCLQEHRPFALNAAEGAKAVRLLLALYQASETGKPVEV